MKSVLKFILVLFIVQYSTGIFAQDIIDVVDPYEMKVSRSKIADTFYFTQNDVNKNKAIDTLRTYDVFLEERLTPFGVAYMCNGAEVTKSKYFEYKRFWDASGACLPCLLYTYGSNDKLKHVAFQYEDCLCGSYKEYHDNEMLKVEGQFRQNQDGEWKSMQGKRQCNIRIGKWTYYSESGVVEKVENYTNDGVLIESKPAKANTSTSKSKNEETDNADNSEEETTQQPQKKGLIKKIKDKTNQR
jgi:antitoxin component YwqK of YwqJK toxin-antitoxin module